MKVITVSSNYEEQEFIELCEALESGEAVRVYVDSLGHHANNLGQEIYRGELLKKYGGKLLVKMLDKQEHSYSYRYELQNKSDLEVLEQFYSDCVKFWIGIGMEDEIAKERAFNDVSNITTNPYIANNSPALDIQVKEQYIQRLKGARENGKGNNS